ncbi:MAG: helicase-related protein, partial [Clostridia bacterium]
VVGFFACYLAFLNGFQSVFMAPTEILARQHAEKFEKLADILGIKFAVLTSSTSTYDRNDIIAKLKTGDISVLFGTQSVIGQEIVYKNLAVAVIDEQHRFGVRERAELEKKGAKYVLSMTATPIPRSLALTFYDDIAISIIKKRENAVTNITTQVVDSENTAKMFKFVANECKNGNQAFVVCPAILDSEGFDIYSLETLIKEYGKTFDGIKLSVLHGKLTNEQKSSIMADFSSGKTDLLLATTVIEVGIDTKAKNIVIMNADRFGLATLHQLRGRVGRDGSPANCFLHTKSVSEKSLSRLNYVKNTNDGETLAEYDFSLRGAGEILGLKQSGESLTPIFGLKVQLDALKNCKSLADNLMQKYTVRELLALTRGSESKVMAFLEYLRNTTLNS